MSFDQSTRNRLQRFVSNARSMLVEEFTRQLQATYGLDPNEGAVADMASLTYLDNRQRQTAHLLRETLAHYLATSTGKNNEERTRQALGRIIREQAFTVLNRLAAVRMAEARGFLLESVAKGYSSKGFQLYKPLAGTAHGETGDAYRNYLFSLFDEFSLDLAVLFDRHSAQGQLFPRESALLALLDEINHPDIEHLWAEDETIGWIYQYFNSQEERRQMRAESQSPRNSRELAVRNQFFTPRYVVEFLTDNTLGRIWYEMTQGNTALADNCRYLVRRPTEIFLQSDETAPESPEGDSEPASQEKALSQEELLKQPVYIPHRPLKDPRSIRMLDPACGSMHFGLYAFDLFERIYLEAWQLEQQLGPDAFMREAGLEALQTTFASLDEFQKQIPKLIIEHNIHGVDIDPRAVQIAGLSLWQRAQRAWHQQGIKPHQRPAIVKSNIVCAEPMPGEKALLQEFTDKLNPPVLGQLLEVIFDKMQLAGEAGTLLKIEEEIQTAIQKAREQWLKESGSQSMGDMFQSELDSATPQKKLGFDLRGIDNETFWDDAEQHILQALSDYADRAESSADQKRLFAEDAAKGFAFIELCRKRFDVVLMNPPFGDAAKTTSEYLKIKYPQASSNLFTAFVDRGGKISTNGKVGAITDSTWIKKTDYREFRELVSTITPLEIITDFGWGVLDDANVATAAYIISSSELNSAPKFINLKDIATNEKENHLKEQLKLLFSGQLSDRIYIRDFSFFQNFEKNVFSYDAPEYYIQAFSTWGRLNSYRGAARRGYTPGDTFRFFRCLWEIPTTSIGKDWFVLNNGGAYKPVIGDGLMAAKYSKSSWEEYRPLPGFRLESADWMFSQVPFCGWGKRTDFMYAYPMPKNSMFSNEGHCYFPAEDRNPWNYIGYLSSAFGQSLVNLITGQHKLAGYVGNIPVADEQFLSRLGNLAEEIYSTAISNNYFHENSYEFNIDNFKGISLSEFANKIAIFKNKYKELISKLDEESFTIIDTKGAFEKESGYCRSNTPNILSNQDLDLEGRIISLILGLVIGRFTCSTSRKSPFDEVSIDDLEAIFSSKVGVFTIEEQTSKGFNINFEKIASKRLKDFNLIIETINNTDLKKYFCDTSNFFEFHIKTHTKSRRSAPIYWPLQTPSGSYTLWVYYHRLNEQTLYTCVNDFVEPKLQQVEKDLSALRGKSARSSQEEKELTKLTDLATELRDFRDELLRLAKIWKPNLNDGVQITAAPLWKLFQHKAWQKKLKETWQKLEKGDYDWAHLACSIWPDRVLHKCHQDRSLAIAHDVEDHFWHEVEVPVMRRGRDTGEVKYEWQPKDLSDSALNALVKQLIAEGV